MKKTLMSLAMAASLGLATASSYAAPIKLDNGVDFGSNGSTSTSAFDTLGFNNTLATSIYLGNPLVAGTQVIDTNITSVMTAYGFSTGSQTALDGTPLTMFNPFSPDQYNVNSLNGNGLQNPVDRNGFISGESPDVYGSGRWGLTYLYEIRGVTTGSASSPINYFDGYFNVFYNDGGSTANDGKQVLRLNVTNSTFSSANLDLFGGISFDFDNNGTNDALSDSFVQNFFLDGKLGGATLYSNWLAGNTAVTWHLDTNVFPPVPTNGQLFVGNVDLDPITDGLQGALIRQSVLDGSIDLTVPEPGSLALLGLGLAGLGLAKRRRMLSK